MKKIIQFHVDDITVIFVRKKESSEELLM